MRTIAQLTLREYLRSAFPYVAGGGLLALALVSRLFLGFSFGSDLLETRNLAISSVFLAGLVHAAFFATRIHRLDVERGTLSLLLSKPLSLTAYILGRFLGVLGAGLVQCVAVALAVALLYAVLSTPRGESPEFGPLFASCLIALGPLPVLCAVALFLSTVVTGFAAPIALIGLFATGSLAGETMAGILLPDYGVFGLDEASRPPMAPLLGYGAIYSTFFLVLTHLSIAMRRPQPSQS